MQEADTKGGAVKPTRLLRLLLLKDQFTLKLTLTVVLTRFCEFNDTISKLFSKWNREFNFFVTKSKFIAVIDVLRSITV